MRNAPVSVTAKRVSAPPPAAKTPTKMLVELGDNGGVSVTVVSDGGGPLGLGAGRDKTTMYGSWEEAREYLDQQASGARPAPRPEDGPEEAAEGDAPPLPEAITRTAAAVRPAPAARGVGVTTTAAPPPGRRPPFLG